jgi:hypothetical protein
MEDDYLALEPSSARGRVSAPAMTLLVLCIISLVLLFLELCFDGWLLASGRAQQMSSGEMPVIVRTIWSVLLVLANGVTLAGAWRMKNLRSPRLAQAACILAVLPGKGGQDGQPLPQQPVEKGVWEEWHCRAFSTAVGGQQAHLRRSTRPCVATRWRVWLLLAAKRQLILAREPSLAYILVS